ncbi:MAG: hypothetical protein IKP34_02400, partial [Bacteroidales bacterium]|nr:hypothetical protein [Bacteroidales bacterium]
GLFNTFALSFADNHRNDTLFADFDRFLLNYDSAAVTGEFNSYARSKNILPNDVKGEWITAWLNDIARTTVADTNHTIHADSYRQYLDQLLADTAFTNRLQQKALAEDRRRALINQHSDTYLGYMLKALIARNLFGIEYYYRVMRNSDTGLQQAIKAVKEI